MSPWRLVGIHALIYILLAAAFIFLVSEPLVQWLAPDFSSVEMWLQVVMLGCMFLFLLCAISLAVFLRVRRRKQVAE